MGWGVIMVGWEVICGCGVVVLVVVFVVVLVVVFIIVGVCNFCLVGFEIIVKSLISELIMSFY